MIVAIGCPVEDRAWILPRYLKSLEDLMVPDGYEKQYVFVLGDSVKDKTPDLIIDFMKRHNGAFAVLKKDNPTDQIERTKNRYDFEYLARARNVLAGLAFDGLEADKLLSIDSDIIIEPGGLCKLFDSGFPIAAAPVRNSTNPEVMNFMMFNDWEDESEVKFTRARLKMPDVRYPFVVDLTGACSLIDRDAKDIKYADFCGGEDTGFAMECWYEDIEQVVIPTVYTEHYMDRNNPDTPLICAHFEKREVVKHERTSTQDHIQATA